jgi:hypothetical protein
MKKLIFILLIWGNVSLAQSPLITQTYTDRCTGETFMFSVPSNGQTVVIFYNKSRVFTSNDFANGVLRTWLEETYNWWRNLNPCSAFQTTTTVAQQTAQQAANSAIQSATNVSTPPTSSSSNSSSQENNSKSESSDSKESSDSQESSSEEEEEKDEKKKITTPPIVVANLAGIQGLDGKVATALSLGVSRSSLLGDKSYGVNSMIWSNLKQFLVVGNYSKTHIVKNKIDIISSTAVGVAKMYSTYLFSMGHSKVFPGQNGSVFGFNFANNIMSIELSPIKRELSGSFNTVFFYTKPFNFKRLSLGPLVALASNLVTYNFSTRTMDMPHSHILLTGNNFNYTITQRFVANLGIMTTSSLSGEFPTTLALTIGSRFQF